MRIMRNKEVRKKAGLPNSTMYDLIGKKKFPAPIQLGDHAVGWIEEEVDAWIAERIARRDRAAAAKASPAPHSADQPSMKKKRGRPPKVRTVEGIVPATA